MEYIELNTKLGKIKGIDNGDYTEFRGIKFANAKRWEYPKMINSWSGVYDATKYGPCCPQERAFTDDAETSAFYHKEFRLGMDFTYDEDCLTLNIVAPKDAENCPVLIYIYGGSFTGGSSDEGHLSGVDLAKNGVIWVAMNYRINVFGFCSHPDLTDEKGRCGNYGLYDQVTAIKWVKEHIAEFGGDPDNITLSGESAGAMSVDLLISSPPLKGMLKGAVLMSGAAIQRAVAKPKLPEKTRAFWDKVVKYAGKNSIKEVRDELSTEELYWIWRKAYDEEKMPMMVALPTCDGKLITKDNYRMSTVPTDFPMVVSVTSADMFCIALLKVSQMFAKKGMRNGNKVWMANFARHLPGDDIGPWHASDLIYLFKTQDRNWRDFEEIDYKIAEQMNKSLIAFVKNHDPNCDEIPNWEPGIKKPMRFCEDSKMMPWDKKYMLDKTIHNDGPI